MAAMSVLQIGRAEFGHARMSSRPSEIRFADSPTTDQSFVRAGVRRENLGRTNTVLIFPERMVLPDRIELSTSPLPMECSTTELRQHARYSRIGPKGPSGGRFLPQGPLWRKRGAGPGQHQNGVKSAPMDRGRYNWAISGLSVPVPDPSEAPTPRLRRCVYAAGGRDEPTARLHLGRSTPTNIVRRRHRRCFDHRSSSGPQ